MSVVNVPDLAISIVNYHTESHLAACLESLEADLHDLSGETWVFDNGSDDELMKSLRHRFSWVRWTGERENIGFPRANNLVISATRSRYVLLLNPDIIVRPGAIRHMLTFAERRPDVGALSCILIRPDGSIQQGVGDDALDREGFVEKPEVFAACLMVRREVIDRCGPMDESVFMFHEDTEWCQRIAANGWKVGLVAGAEMIHAEKSSYGTLDPFDVERQRTLSRYVFGTRSRSRLGERWWLAASFVKSLWCTIWYRHLSRLSSKKSRSEKLERHRARVSIFRDLWQGKASARTNLLKQDKGGRDG